MIRLAERDVPRIGLGTNRLTNRPEHVAFVRAALESGIGLVDTAHTYAGGQSEEAIGAALASGAGEVLVATKGGFAPGTGRPEVLTEQIETSLRRLGSRTIDLYYLHRVDPQTPLEDSLGAIGRYVDRGAIRQVGLSEAGVDVIEQARRARPIAAVQNHYSLAERRWDDVVDYCEREGLVFVPFFPLRGVGGGSVERVGRRRAATTSQIALAWLLARSPAILPIPGTLSLEHVSENVAALDIDLTPDELAELGSPAPA
jgi:aryl-alcohol dehydrogenase-like predicted oxidoreductase